jgi:hypothetical protein
MLIDAVVRTEAIRIVNCYGPSSQQQQKLPMWPLDRRWVDARRELTGRLLASGAVRVLLTMVCTELLSF